MKNHSPDQLVRIDVSTLMQGIKARLGVSYGMLERYSGRAYNTLEGWTVGTGAHQIEGLLRLLARLPAAQRHQLIDAACPCFPSLAHPFLARDRLLAAHLDTLLDQPKGTTLVIGESDYLTSFVGTALGHSFTLGKAKDGSIAGLDSHVANWFIPVPGVSYVGPAPQPDLIQAQTKREAQWQKSGLLLLNQVCSRYPEIEAAAQRASDHTHVVVVEARLPVRNLGRFAQPLTVITVGLDRRHAQREDDASQILVAVQQRDGSAAQGRGSV